MTRDHLTTKTLAVALQVVNAVEQQELAVDPWMVQLQRQAWDLDLPVVFPVRREPDTDWGWEPRGTISQRVRIEETIRQAEEVAGRPIWLKHDLDFRGRLYCSSRIAGHQGPDHQKALISFAQKERLDDAAFDQLLAAAAGHHSLSKASWAERIQWGRSHLDQLARIAAEPLDLLDQWKGADDPWQFMQAAKAVADFLADEATPIGCPVRFDQTASGMGIIGALLRDRRLCHHTNVIGESRSDLYGVVAAAVIHHLRQDLDSFDPIATRWSEFWLKLPIDRSLAKGPTMTMVYGSRHMGVTQQLIDWLQERNPDIDIRDWQKEYTRPASYLAKVFGKVLAKEMASAKKLEDWLKAISLTCTKQQQQVRWTSPLGFPLSLAALLDRDAKTSTLINGSRRWTQIDQNPEPGELSAKATNRGITANTIHAFDAALVHQLVLSCAAIGVPLLTNHDCFATIPSRAGWLHGELMAQLKALYSPDHLAAMRKEISKNAGVTLPARPKIGTLMTEEIGQNPYCFC